MPINLKNNAYFLQSLTHSALHLVNHKRPSCKVLYNPEKVRDTVPEANFMVAEETFTWLSRYKKILNSMKRIQFHFVLHRLVINRNRYSSNMYKDKRKPKLPSAKVSRNDKE